MKKLMLLLVSSMLVQCSVNAMDDQESPRKRRRVDQDQPAMIDPLALHKAVEAGDKVLVKSLLNAANVNQQDGEGKTPLHIADRNNDWAMVETLLEAGARADIKDNDGQAPIHRNAYQDRPEIMQLFVNAGAPVDLPDDAGNTPLHYAATNSNRETFRILLNAGADVSLTTNAGITVLTMAGTDEALVQIIQDNLDQKAELARKEARQELLTLRETDHHRVGVGCTFPAVPTDFYRNMFQLLKTAHR